MSQHTDYLPRHLDAALGGALPSAPVVILDGARGSGKTTTARRFARSNVMLPRDVEALRADAEGYLRALPSPVLVDEWQLAGTDLLWVVKRIVDDDPAPGRFILTGSVEPATYGPTYPLTGRAVRLVMRPMTVAELDGHGAGTTFLQRIRNGGAVAPSAGQDPTFDPSWLARPGFPAARDLPEPGIFLDAYAALVSQRAGDEGRDAGRLMRTLRTLAIFSAQTVPDQRIWEAADISKPTWKAYEDLLHRTHLAAPSPAFETNRLKRLTHYPKQFLSDTSLALTLAGVSTADLENRSPAAGRFLESFVLQQLRPQVDQVNGSLMHLRTGAGEREVDVVIEIGGSVIGLEVKFGTRPTRHDARQLDWMRSELGERFSQGFVVHTGGDTFPLDDRIWAVPVTTLIETA